MERMIKMIKIGIWREPNGDYLYGFLDQLADGSIVYESPELRDYIMENEIELEAITCIRGHEVLKMFCNTNKHVRMYPEYWDKDYGTEDLVKEFNAKVYVMTPVGKKQIH